MRKLAIALSLIFWPLSLYLANTQQDLIRYLFPTFLVLISFFLSKYQPKLYLLPLLLIPFIEAKLALLPLLVALADLFQSRNKHTLYFLILAILVIILNWRSFYGQTIFTQDYQAQQDILTNSNLYSNIFEARVFQNKARIYIDKFNDNFFALTDPNNYFFGFHPAEITLDNQNLKKFPFLGIIFMLVGLLNLGHYRLKRFALVTLFSSLMSLSILKIFDRNDFILWVPLGLILVHGFTILNKKVLYWIYLVFTLWQMIYIIASFSK